MKRVVVTSLLIILFLNTTVFAGREYILKYAYPDKVKTISIYDLLGGGKVSSRVSSSKRDKTSPYVKSSIPKNGAVNVKVGSNITLIFNEKVKLSTNYKNITLIGNGKRITLNIKINNNKVSLSPNTVLSYGTSYVLNVPKSAFKDAAGNVNKAFSIKFKTEDLKFAKDAASQSAIFSFLFDDGKNIVKNYSYKKDGEYLFFADLKNIEKTNGIKFDENSIPMANYNGEKYNPLLIAEWGLQNYSYYKRNQNGEYFKKAKRAADFLVENIDPRGLWINEFDYKEGTISMKKGWSSSLTQGLGISLLIRIYGDTKDEKYLDAAKIAFEPLKVELRESLNGYPLYDMFNVRSKYTFSSFMFVLFAIYDISDFDDSAKDMFYAGVETLRQLIPNYYETSDKFYKAIHDAQLKALCSILDVDSINEYLEDFKVVDIE